MGYSNLGNALDQAAPRAASVPFLREQRLVAISGSFAGRHEGGDSPGLPIHGLALRRAGEVLQRLLL